MPKDKSLERSVLRCNLITHYDTTVYALLIPTIAPLFFEDQDAIFSVIKGYSGLLIGIITRPLGILYFSRLAKNKGYVNAFVKSMLGITFTTCAIAFLPTQDTIKMLAPVALLSIRSLQAFFSAGESNLAKVYIMNKNISHNDNRCAAQYEVYSLCGIALAFMVAYFCSKYPDFWRLAFFISFFGTAFATAFRFFNQDISKNSTNQSSADYSAKNLFSIIKNNKKVLLQISVLHGFNYFTYSFVFIFANVFVCSVNPNIDYSKMMSFNVPFLCLDILFLLAIYRTKMLNSALKLASSLPILLGILVLITFCQNDTRLYLCINILRGVTVIIGVLCSIAFSVLTLRICKKLFGDEYVLYGLFYCLGSDILGRSLPAVGLFLIQFSKSLWPTTILCVSICLCTSICFTALQKISANKTDQC